MLVAIVDGVARTVFFVCGFGCVTDEKKYNVLVIQCETNVY
jgi:hypothetical protein